MARGDRGTRRSGSADVERNSAGPDWGAVNGRLADIDPQDTQGLRDAIAALYEAAASTIEPLLQEFESFGEAELAKGCEERAAQAARGRIRVAEDLEPRAALLDAARLLRALEINLSELGRFLESDLADDLERAWRTSDGCHYVIPRVTPLASGDGKPFLRRALRHHRVIPASADGFAVRLHRLPLAADAASAARERASPGRRYGAAWFPGLAVTLASPATDTFLIERLDGFDADAMIAAHLERAAEEGCTALVWGELTMPETSIAQLRERLAARALDGPTMLQYLVAGSWHRTVDGKMRNAASILDGLGEPLFEVFKWAKFKIDGKREAIEPGREVHVLIGEDELIAVAICRDFLQETGELPYRRLNVDVAVVPSMTSGVPDPDTMLGHAATANTMRVRYGTRTLVVAQPAYAAEGPIGEVLAFPAKPLRGGSEIVEEPFRLCILETR